MLLRDIKRSSLFVGPVLILLYLGISFYQRSDALRAQVEDWIDSSPKALYQEDEVVLESTGGPKTLSSIASETSAASPSSSPLEPLQIKTTVPEPPSSDDLPDVNSATESLDQDNADPGHVGEVGSFVEHDGVQHQEVFSLSTNDKKFFSIDFGAEMQGMNPNILPHPVQQDTWIVIAQRVKEDPSSPWFTEIACDAVFQDNVLRCSHTPVPLPVSATPGERCEGDFSYMNFNIGPHDARVFLGPENPYIVFGSNSMYTCFGQFVQDFRMLVDSGFDTTGLSLSNYRLSTELQRPSPWGTMEKNWFLFWDADGQSYVHYDISPKRVFSLLGSDGSAGPDLAPLAAQLDEACLAKYLPRPAPELESVHQATNSLKITMCRKQDASCQPDETNTFIFTIYQHKTYYSYHSVYEPHVMVFNQRAPFAIHAMSTKPIWIHGRERYVEKNTSDMFYVTSMSWKSRENKYHGYLDDELLLAFGIEDEKSGGIDILAGDILDAIELCNQS